MPINRRFFAKPSFDLCIANAIHSQHKMRWDFIFKEKRETMKTLIYSSWLILAMVAAPALADKQAATKASNQAEVLIESAERAGGMQHAVYLMKSAQDNLNQAKVDYEKRNWTDAEISAKKSQRDAEVAGSKAKAMKAEQAYSDLRQSVDLLRNELQRKRSGQ